MGEINSHNLMKNTIDTVKTINLKSTNPYEDIFNPPKKRQGFVYNEKTIDIPIYFYRVIGIEEGLTCGGYEINLLELHQRLSVLGPLYSKLDSGLNPYVPRELIERINQQLVEVREVNQFTTEILKKTLNSLLASPTSLIKNEVISKKLTEVLSIYIDNYNDLHMVKSFLIKLLYWIEKYTIPQLSNLQLEEINPKVLFYGDIKRDEVYYLVFISLLGFDVLYINPLEEGDFSQIPRIESYSRKILYPQRNIIQQFPNVDEIKRKETIAYQASKEIDEVIHTEESGIYRRWQFEDYEVVANSLKTTYEELFILWKEEARFREGFKVEKGKIYIPNIFSKISGTSSDMKLYWDYFNSLIEKNETTIFIEKIPFMSVATPQVNPNLFNRDGSFKTEKVKELKEYQFNYLKTSIQELILSKMNKLITTDLLSYTITPEFKMKVLYTVLSLNKKYLQLLQKFDYPYEIPKIVIFDRAKGRFTKEYNIVISFLHLVGFDIVIYTPTGYNNIENGINQSYYDVHKLEDVSFNIENVEYLKEKPQPDQKKLFSKFFFWFFK